jgi:GMP synthase-like glutamine amidotransferase
MARVALVNCLNIDTDEQGRRVTLERFRTWLPEATFVEVLARTEGATPQLPRDVSELDAVILTGSPTKAFDRTTPWLQHLRVWLERVVLPKAPRVKVLGLCAGAQMLAMALGGGCVPLENGPEIGLRCIEGCELEELKNGYRLIETHAEKIVLPDSDRFRSMGKTKRCIQGFYTEAAMGIQGHPEYSNEDGRVRFLLRLQNGEVTQEYCDEAIDSLNRGPNDGPRVGSAVVYPWMCGKLQL